MSDTTTIARPYAKAIFEHAVTVKQLTLWSVALANLAEAVKSAEAKPVIGNPTVPVELQSQLLMAVISKAGETDELKVVESLIHILAQNKRLAVLPDIQVQFETLRAEQEKTIEVQVSSFSELTSAQQQQLMHSLSQRLQREITLDITIDKSLLGGAIIRAGDLVIDGSVRGKLNKLSTDLAA